MTDTLSWINLALVIIAWILIGVIYIVYFTRSSDLERQGLAWNIQQGSTSSGAESFTAGNYTMYFINSSATTYTLTINANSSIKVGNEFAIYNNTSSSKTIAKGTGVVISGANTGTIQGNTLAVYIATKDSNTFTRVQ